jgi:hypothetical protein
MAAFAIPIDMQPAPVLPVVDAGLLSILPPVLRAVVRALGVARAREWLMDHGGRNVCVPFFQGAGLTPDEVARLRRELHNHLDESGRVTLPKPDKILNHYRDQQIRREHAHASLAALARHYGLTTRQIQNICREETGAEIQGRLF